MKNKGISLIVLVITILVLSILATTVIISLSNTNIIEQAGNSVKQSNEQAIKEAVNFEVLSVIANPANNGELKMDELKDKLEDKDYEVAKDIDNGWIVAKKDGVVVTIDANSKIATKFLNIPTRENMPEGAILGWDPTFPVYFDCQDTAGVYLRNFDPDRGEWYSYRNNFEPEGSTMFKYGGFVYRFNASAGFTCQDDRAWFNENTNKWGVMVDPSVENVDVSLLCEKLFGYDVDLSGLFIDIPEIEIYYSRPHN